MIGEHVQESTSFFFVRLVEDKVIGRVPAAHVHSAKFQIRTVLIEPNMVLARRVLPQGLDVPHLIP